MEINDTVLDHWIKHRYNVLMCGRRGTGKTTQIVSAFERAGLKWQYFSAPTMDPWVDFVGVPKEKVSEKGNSYLEMIRPKQFADDEIEAIFFDELNRAKPKIMDASMELIQFKSINGRKFKNLKMVWGAINPKNHGGDEEEEYAVEELDPAHRDRFQIYVETEYKLSEEFFYKQFPEGVAEAGISWWNRLKEKEKNKVSPRRLEYALINFMNDGDIAYNLPKEVNPSNLAIQLKNGSFSRKFKELYKANNPEEIKKALLNENFYNAVKDEILSKKEYMEVFAPHFPNEKFNNLVVTDPKFKNFILNDRKALEASIENLRYILDANAANHKIIKEIKEKMTAYKLYEQTPINQIVENHYDNLGDAFFKNTESKMRIAGAIQNHQDSTVFDKNTIVKAAVILSLVVEHTNLEAWLSVKLGLKQLKAELPRIGMTFEQLAEMIYTDPQYQKYKQNEGKLQKVFTNEGLLSDGSMAAGTKAKA